MTRAMTRAMLRVVAGSACFLALVGVPAAEGQGEPPVKIAVVDLDALVAQSAKGRELQSRLEQFQQQAQQEINAKSEQLLDIRQRITDGVNSLSDERLAELNKELEDGTIALRRLRDDKQREGQKIQDEGLRALEREMEPVFQQVRDEMGIDLILNRVPGMVLMASDRVDITELLIERFNATAESASGD